MANVSWLLKQPSVCKRRGKEREEMDTRLALPTAAVKRHTHPSVLSFASA